MFAENVSHFRRSCWFSVLLLVGDVLAADVSNDDAIEQTPKTPVVVSRPFDAEEMDRLYAKLGISKSDPNYLLIEGTYTVENGRRKGNVVEIVPKATYQLGELCVMEPQLFNVRITETQLDIFGPNVRSERFVGLGESEDQCASLTYKDMQTDGHLVPLDIDLEAVLAIIGSLGTYVSAVGEFAKDDLSQELALLQIYDAEDYDENADVCMTLFRQSTSVRYQVCVTLGEKRIEVSSVDYFVHKYERPPK